jgi:hypothetical protein
VATRFAAAVSTARAVLSWLRDPSVGSPDASRAFRQDPKNLASVFRLGAPAATSERHR